MANYKISTDLFRPSIAVNTFNQSNTYVLEVTLTERGRNFVPSSGSTFILTCLRSDNVLVRQDIGITNAIGTNVILITLDSQCVAYKGDIKFNLIVTNTTLGTVNTFAFNGVVQASVVSDTSVNPAFRDVMITSLLNASKSPFFDETTHTLWQFNPTTGLMEDTGELEIINDLTTGGEDKLTSAEMVKKLNDEKTAKTVPAVVGNLATLDANGNLVDGGKTVSQLQLNNSDLEADTVLVNEDYIPYVKTSDSTHKKTLFSNIISKIRTAILGTSSGILKANGSGVVSVAQAGTDYIASIPNSDSVAEGVDHLFHTPARVNAIIDNKLEISALTVQKIGNDIPIVKANPDTNIEIVTVTPKHTMITVNSTEYDMRNYHTFYTGLNITPDNIAQISGGSLFDTMQIDIDGDISETYDIPLPVRLYDAYFNAIYMSQLVCQNNLFGVLAKTYSFKLEDSTEVAYITSYGNYYCYKVKMPIYTVNGMLAFSTHFQYKGDNSESEHYRCVDRLNLFVYIANTRLPNNTAQSLISYAQAQTTAGTPITFLYGLETPTFFPLSEAAQLTMNNLQILNENCTISIPDCLTLTLNFTSLAESSADYSGEISFWGDSLTMGAEDINGVTISNIVARLSGRTCYNWGVGGEKMRTIAGRQGGYPMLVNPCTIPASGGVAVTLKSCDDGEVAPLLQVPTRSGINPCSINGIIGTLSYATGVYTFTRTTAGDSSVIAKPTALITNASKENVKDINVIWIGANDGYDVDVDDLIGIIKSMIDYSKHRKKEYIVVGLSTGWTENRAVVDKRMLNEFGRRFINIRKYLVDYGLADAGISPTAQDTTDISTGVVPTSLRVDGVHFTEAGYTVIGTQIYNRLAELETV